ncbi:coxsackievirus and adenovirus receptor homolog [Girardinichthys multiradiatus]|uniref:coxsackievirus and adenovirus receptor homolog n=1 Tax=Girardinichthys multiradiatus TaxID=208333 RepID=UPI001FAD0F3B|nr:coxsackievirus and adenovirus receptor homolog [Girardinichthys multiradiatus]
MAPFLTASSTWTLLVFCSFMAVSADQRIIRAEPGEEVILPCRPAEKKDVVVVEWIRTDLKSDQYVLLYRDEQFDPDAQSPSFKNRVDLKDVKNGDVSLVLKNVTTDDTGRYECRVVQRGNNRRKRSNLKTNLISTIDLIVQGNKDGGNEDGGNQTGLIVGLSVVGVVVVVVVGAVLMLRRKQIRSSLKSNPPPAEEAEDENMVTGP